MDEERKRGAGREREAGADGDEGRRRESRPYSEGERGRGAEAGREPGAGQGEGAGAGQGEGAGAEADREPGRESEAGPGHGAGAEPGAEPGPERGSSGGGPHGVQRGRRVRHRLRPGVRSGWRSFTSTPFFPATVLALIVAAAAGLFAASYTYAMADPTPRDIPAAVVGKAAEDQRVHAFRNGLEDALGSSLEVHRYRTYAQAVQAVGRQEVFTVLRLNARGRVVLDLASAAGAPVAEVLRQTAPKVARDSGVRVTIGDLKPLAKGDPRGLTIFYMTLAADIVGFIGAIQLSVNVPDLSPVPRLCFIAAYALLGGFVIAAMVDWALGAVTLPFAHSWAILALTMFTSGSVFLMFNALIGRWAMIPTWFVMVLLGNPSSGGAVSWPLLPSLLGEVGRWLPPGASVNAQHTAVYFGGDQHAMPYVVLVAWAAGCVWVFLALGARRRRAEARAQ